jgi:NAD-dependent SIR2 family protein deacetylase
MSASELGIEKFELNYDLFEIKKIPRCSTCEGNINLTKLGMLRPNILMFDDEQYAFDRFQDQNEYFMEFMEKNKREGITVIEIGAGIEVDNIRSLGDNLLLKDEYPSALIRINPKIENLIIKEMLNRGLLTQERYNEYMDGEDIDVEKELAESSQSNIYIYFR